MGTSIGYDFVIEVKVEVYFVGKECSYFFSGDIFLSGTENHPLSKPMVYHHQKGIRASGRGEVSDKVTRDLLEGVRHRGASGGERGNSGVCVGLVLLTGCIIFDILANVGGQAGPPDFSHNELASFQVSGVASGFIIMATLKDGVAKGFVIGNIHRCDLGR